MEHPVQIPAAEQIEHLAWLNSPPTRELVKLIQRKRDLETKTVVAMSLGSTSSDIEIRARLAKIWTYDNVIGLVEKLPDAKHE